MVYQPQTKTDKQIQAFVNVKLLASVILRMST